MNSNHLVHLVRDADPERSQATLSRRLFKAAEELGELAEAFLGVTSVNNTKDKTWGDVREESVDLLIMAIDCALTPIKGYEDKGETYICTRINLGSYEAVGRQPEILKEGMRIAGCISTIEDLHQYDAWQYGTIRNAMSLMLVGAARLAFSPLPEGSQDHDVIRHEVYALFEKKIEKWTSGRSTSMIAKDI